MTPEEKRKRDRERKRRQRQAASEKPRLEALPKIGPSFDADGGTQGGTEGGTSADAFADMLSNLAAARMVIADLEVPPSARWRIALVLRLAADLDQPGAIPQRAGLAARYTENLEALVSAAKPRERDELDDLRRRFYTGSVDGIDDDPEAPVKRAVRKKA